MNSFTRAVQLLFASFILMIFQVNFAEGREPCNFLCQEIPNANEVIKGWGKPTQPALKNPTLKILAWNIYKGRMEFFGKDFATLARGSDVVMLSEGTDGVLVKPTLDRYQGIGWLMGISFFMKEEVGTGLITGTAAKPTAWAYTRTKDLEPWVKSPKVILISKYMHAPTNQEILFLNIHGINWVDDAAFARQIQSVEPYLKAHAGPVVFAGDFNIKKNTPRLQIVEKIVGKYGLKRAPWKNPNVEKQLDDAFVKGFDVKRAEIIYEVVDHGSDHPALILELAPLRRR